MRESKTQSLSSLVKRCRGTATSASTAAFSGQFSKAKLRVLQDAKPAAKPIKRNKSTGTLLPGPSLIPPGPPSTLKRQLSRKSLSKLDHPAASEGAAEEEAGSEQVMGKGTATTC